MEGKIIDFLKPKKGKYKNLKEVDIFLNTTLGVKNKFYWDLDDKFRKYYTSNINEQYLQNILFVYFIDINVRLDMSLRKSSLIAPVRNILTGDFIEKAIEIKFYSKFLRQVMVGPKIIIINLPADSILIDDQPIIDKLKEYT